MKTCSLCGRLKPIESFYRHSGAKDGRRGECRSCVCHKSAERLKGETTQKREYRIRWKREYNSRPERQAKLHAYSLRRYGLTIQEYESLLVTQGGACKICKVRHDEKQKRGRLHVDHCHKTGKVRGLLCHRCNSLLGFARDNDSILVDAIAYLKLP